MSEFYDDQSINTIERVKLAQDVKLPKVTTEPLTLKFLENGGKYVSPFNAYSDIKAKFFMPIMSPLMSGENASNDKKASPSVKNQKGSSKLQVNSYNSSNYIELVIPKYILMNFVDIVPKGTEFIVGSINGSLSIGKMKIIGIYSTSGEE